MRAEGRKRTGESVHRRKRRKRRGLGNSSNAVCGSPKREGGLPNLINSERGMRSAGNRSNAECGMRTGESVHRRKRNEGPQPRFQNLRANSSLPSLPSVRRFALVPKPGTLIHRKRNEGDSVGGTPTGATGTVAL